MKKLFLIVLLLGVNGSAGETPSGQVRILACDRWTYFYETRSWSCTSTPHEVFVAAPEKIAALEQEIQELKVLLKNR